tara:strand:+ start:838 stop:1056 length:219 start_codon:yes stop_codon:yes gene_type:complete
VNIEIHTGYKTDERLDEFEPYLNLKEVSKMLGVTPQTIVAYVKSKNMPYHRIGKDGQYKFLQSEIHNWSKKQ